MGVLCWSLFCYVFLCLLSSFDNTLTRKREMVALLLKLIVILMPCDCECSIGLPHDAVG